MEEYNINNSYGYKYQPLNTQSGKCVSKCLCNMGERSLYDQIQMKRYDPNIFTPKYIEAYDVKYSNLNKRRN